MTKNRPGPLAPPALRRPSLKMTALSYSWTTLTHMKRERGRVARNRRNETAVRKREQIPGPSGSATTSGGFMFGSISGLGGNRTYGVKCSVLLVIYRQFRVYRIVFPATVRVNVSSTFLVCYLKMNFTLEKLCWENYQIMKSALTYFLSQTFLIFVFSSWGQTSSRRSLVKINDSEVGWAVGTIIITARTKTIFSAVWNLIIWNLRHPHTKRLLSKITIL